MKGNKKMNLTVSLNPETKESLNRYRQALLSLPYNDRTSRLVDIITMLFEVEQEGYGDA
jgi:hypothetical protein